MDDATQTQIWEHSACTTHTHTHISRQAHTHKHTHANTRLGTRLGTATRWDGRALAVAHAAHVRGARACEPSPGTALNTVPAPAEPHVLPLLGALRVEPTAPGSELASHFPLRPSSRRAHPASLRAPGCHRPAAAPSNAFPTLQCVAGAVHPRPRPNNTSTLQRTRGRPWFKNRWCTGIQHSCPPEGQSANTLRHRRTQGAVTRCPSPTTHLGVWPLCNLWDLVLGFVGRTGPTAPAVVPGGESKMMAGAAASVAARTPGATLPIPGVTPLINWPDDLRTTIVASGA